MRRDLKLNLPSLPFDNAPDGEGAGLKLVLIHGRYGTWRGILVNEDGYLIDEVRMPTAEEVIATVAANYPQASFQPEEDSCPDQING